MFLHLSIMDISVALTPKQPVLQALLVWFTCSFGSVCRIQLTIHRNRAFFQLKRGSTQFHEPIALNVCNGKGSRGVLGGLLMLVAGVSIVTGGDLLFREGSIVPGRVWRLKGLLMLAAGRSIVADGDLLFPRWIYCCWGYFVAGGLMLLGILLLLAVGYLVY